MANKDTVRKLPMKAIKQDYDKYKETVEVDFKEEDGKTYRVTLHPYFQPDKVNELIEQFGKDLNEITNAKIEFPDKLIPTYLIFSCLIKFSDFPIPKSKDIKKKISYFTQVINTKYFTECANMLLDKEIGKVWDKLMEILAENEKLERMVAKTQEEIRNYDFKSPELREKVLGKQIPEA